MSRLALRESIAAWTLARAKPVVWAKWRLLAVISVAPAASARTASSSKTRSSAWLSELAREARRCKTSDMQFPFVGYAGSEADKATGSGVCGRSSAGHSITTSRWQ